MSLLAVECLETEDWASNKRSHACLKLQMCSLSTAMLEDDRCKQQVTLVITRLTVGACFFKLASAICIDYSDLQFCTGGKCIELPVSDPTLEIATTNIDIFSYRGKRPKGIGRWQTTHIKI